MIPVQPPTHAGTPGYPTRARLLGDAALRRHVLGALAAAALAGCAGEPVQPSRTGETQPPPIAPQPQVPPEPQPLAGLIMPAEQPEPQQLRGDVASPSVPEPAPLPGKPAPPKP